jgi:AraC-like DNA-binding protein
MTPPAFCRFFKNSTNKTFLQFLNEFRVGKSCQLLINGEKNIKQICYEVGFNSLTNFNRVFKSFKGQSPTEYRAAFRAIRLQEG